MVTPEKTVLRIAIDIDGVLADEGKCLSLALSEVYGIQKKPEELVHYNWPHWLGLSDSEVQDFFQLALFELGPLPLMPGAGDGMDELQSLGHDLVIVTNRKQQGLEATLDWLALYGWDQIHTLFVRAGDEMIDVDIMLDDSPKKLVELSPHIREQSFLLSHPYNLDCLDVKGRFCRVTGWEDFMVYVRSYESRSDLMAY